MKKLLFIFSFLFFFVSKSFTQENLQTLGDSVHDINKKRVYTVAALHAVTYTSTIYLLGQTWYKNYPKTSFHTFNDSKEWLRVDKIGHAWTAYSLAKYSTASWQWTGLENKKAVILGGISSITFQTILEYFDAHSAEWGWSWADVGANFSGAGLFVAQELLWRDQRLQFKFSAHKKKYSNDLHLRADDLFGNTFSERILKDYNNQTYWLSFNASSFLPKTSFPKWLNISIGYGGDGMFGGFENIAKDKNDNIVFDRRDIKRKRQWYISPDVDLTKIKTAKKSVRTLLNVLNAIKIPAPTLEFSNGKAKFHALYF